MWVLDIVFNLLRLTLVLSFVFGGIAAAQMTREEALAQAFPGAEIRAERVFLTEAQKRAAEVQSGVKVPSLLIARYVATEGGNLVGRAYIDTHVVRTKNESLLITIDPEGQVRRIEVTAFLEPPPVHGSGRVVGSIRRTALERGFELESHDSADCGCHVDGASDDRRGSTSTSYQ